MNDPLAGQRQAINEGANSLLWLSSSKAAPVKVGDLFQLRSCGIEITKTHRVKIQGEWHWRAEFTRIQRKHRVYLLKAAGWGAGDEAYVETSKGARKSQDDAVSASTLDPIAPDDRSDAHRGLGEPPEPEAVPPHEIKEYRKSIEANLRHRAQRAQELETEEGRRKRERGIRDELRETMKELRVENRINLLASISKSIQDAKEEIAA